MVRASVRRRFLFDIHLIETVDVMDHDGKLKELSTHFDDYASQFLTARSTYYILKVEGESISTVANRCQRRSSLSSSGRNNG